jgi:hypothetical protein
LSFAAIFQLEPKLVISDQDYPGSIHVFRARRDTGEGSAGSGGGPLQRFATVLTNVLGRPVVVETGDATPLQWRIHRDALDTELIDEVLDNLEIQTGLDFTLEERPTPCSSIPTQATTALTTALQRLTRAPTRRPQVSAPPTSRDACGWRTKPLTSAATRVRESSSRRL